MFLDDATSQWILPRAMIPATMVTKVMSSKYIKELANDAPEYEEIRDMFSEGQVASDLWLAHHLDELCDEVCTMPHRGMIVNSWYGTLASILQTTNLVSTELILLDKDPRCKKVIDVVKPFPNSHSVKAFTGDLYTQDYGEYDLVINTACEFTQMQPWLEGVHEGTLVVLQSSDTFGDTNEEVLAEEAQLQTVLMQGKLHCHSYDRYMVIGYK